MTNLTEQWKKGELPKGYYYCKTENTEILRINRYNQLEDIDGEVFIGVMDDCEIITPVPSYEEWEQLKERLYEFAEANQSLRKKLDEERAKNRIDYYNGSPMDFLDECERDRKQNKIYKNWINNIKKEIIISDLRRTEEGNKFIVNLLAKINQLLGEE